MILVFSDVHLGYKKCNKEDFSRFLDEIKTKEIEHLVILGDLFDFWRRKNAEIILENDDILKKLDNINAKNIHYVIGNHDYYMLKLDKRYENNYPFTVSKFLRLENGEKNFYFIHGYEFEAINLEPITLEDYEDLSESMCLNGNMVGKIEDESWDLAQKTIDEIEETFNRFREVTDKMKSLENQMKQNSRDRLESLVETKKIYNLAISHGKYYLLGMKPDERLVFGHTHGPFINKEKTVVNTGSWVDELKSKQYQNSYVEINEGNIELKFFNP